jgi:uncharacterized membrane protein
VARGLAVLTMFVAHGYDGWLAAEHRGTLAFRVTREIAAVAMPGFVVFAGIGLGLSLQLARPTRGSVVARGLRLILAGYALSLAYAVIDDGLVWATVLRADALHAIGASLALCAVVLVRPSAAALRTRAAALAVLLLAVTRPLSLALGDVASPMSYVIAPWVRIEGLTRFAAMPLSALCAGGVALAAGGLLPRLGRTSAALSVALGSSLLAAASWLACAHLVHSLGGPLSPSHVAVLPNALDGFCRALCVLSLGALVVLHAPAGLREALRALGRRSLWVYALHLPLCYGRLAAPLRSRLDFAEATVGVVGLSILAAALAVASSRKPARDDP